MKIGWDFPFHVGGIDYVRYVLVSCFQQNLFYLNFYKIGESIDFNDFNVVDLVSTFLSFLLLGKFPPHHPQSSF
jgi:hypothetical protein